MEACPKIEVIQLPKSYRRTVSKSIEMFLEMQRIQLIEGDVWGHRKDISEYKVIPPSVFSDIEKMTQERVDQDKIVHDVGARYRLPESLIEFVIKKGVTT